MQQNFVKYFNTYFSILHKYGFEKLQSYVHKIYQRQKSIRSWQAFIYNYSFFNFISSYNKLMDFKEIQLVTRNKISNDGKIVTLNETLDNILPTSSEPSRRLMELEGECKVKSFVGLKIMWVKAILMTILIVCSCIGLLLIKYFKSLRVLAFYSKCSND